MKAVEVLFFDGCPNVDIAMSHVQEAIVQAGILADVRAVRVEEGADAVRLRFLGSPTVRVGGVDVDAAARARTDFGMQCRVYATNVRLTGAPPVSWIEAALRGEAHQTSDGEVAGACCCSPNAQKDSR